MKGSIMEDGGDEKENGARNPERVKKSLIKN